MTKIINVSHIDLDGIGSYYVLRECFNRPELSTYFINYPYTERHLEVISKKVSSETKMFVMTDLSLKTEDKEWVRKLTQEILPANCYKIFIDHHDSTDESLKEYFNEWVFDSSGKHAGCGLTYKVFQRYIKTQVPEKLQQIEEFNKIADNYDLWKLDSYWEKGLELTDLIENFSIYDVKDWDYNTLLNPSSNYVLKQLLNNINSKKKYKLDKLRNSANRRNFDLNHKTYSICHFYSSNYRNYLCHFLNDEITLCANIETFSISFRVKNMDIEINKFCEFFNGGGHHLAAAARFEEKLFFNPNVIIDSLILFLQRKIENPKEYCENKMITF